LRPGNGFFFAPKFCQHARQPFPFHGVLVAVSAAGLCRCLLPLRFIVGGQRIGDVLVRS
jgi:hypothetical protein